MCWLNDGSHIDCLNQAKWRVQGSKDPSNRPIILQPHRVPHFIRIINQRTEEDKWESWLGHFGRSPMRSVEPTNRPPPQTTSNTFQPLLKVIRSHDVLGRWIQRSADLSGGRPTSLRNSTTSHFVYNTPSTSWPYIHLCWHHSWAWKQGEDSEYLAEQYQLVSRK